MKYRVSDVPNTGHAVNFKLQSAKGDQQSLFCFSRQIMDVWGNPQKSSLKEVMVAYVKRHGWQKEPVTMTPKNSPRSLSCYVAELLSAKKAKA